MGGIQDKKDDQKTVDKSENQKQDDTDKKSDEQDKKKDSDSTEQNKESEQNQNAEPETIESLKKSFESIREMLVLKQAQYSATTDTDEKTKLYSEFLLELDKANQQVAKIQKLALEKLKADPADESVLKTLIGLLVNHAQQDSSGDKALLLGDALIKAGVDTKYYDIALNAPRLSLFGKEVIQEIVVRDKEFRADDLPRVKISTTKGDFVVELFENEAPDTVGNFVSLIESGFYTNSPFHRVMEGFMAQGGQAAEGKEDIDYTIYCECDKLEARKHYPGCLSMAKTPMPNTGSSEFFILFSRRPGLDNQHTVFGRVIEGLDVYTQLSVNVQTDPVRRVEVPIEGAETDKILSMEVMRKRPHEYKPNKVSTDVPGEAPDDLTKANNKTSADDKKGDDKKGDDKKGDDKKGDDNEKQKDGGDPANLLSL